MHSIFRHETETARLANESEVGVGTGSPIYACVLALFFPVPLLSQEIPTPPWPCDVITKRQPVVQNWGQRKKKKKARQHLATVADGSVMCGRRSRPVLHPPPPSLGKVVRAN